MRNIKSKERVKLKGEVFTRKIEIKNMLNLIPNITKEMTFLEPSCGNGNFIIEIFKYKLRTTNKKENDLLKCLSTIYAVDIMQDNIEECKKRMLNYIKKLGFKNSLIKCENIMNNNFKVGDFLNDNIVFDEYKY